MKKKVIILLVIFFIAFIITGCDGFTPSIPDDEYDEENTELAYIKVLPTQADMMINQSKKFEVKAYNSDNKLIAIDVSMIQWIVAYECSACGVVWKLSLTENSFQTTFTPLETGSYKLWAKYVGEENKWAKATIEVY